MTTPDQCLILETPTLKERDMEKVFTLQNADKFAQYESYWHSITPQTDGQIFQRWLFAFSSIHTTWESNMNLYNSIKNFEEWINNSELLMQRLIEGRAGLHNQRYINILSFSKKFWANPDAFKKSSNESWVDLRNRLAKDLTGIGLAKTSFALELCYPNTVEVVCLDVHMLRLLNLNEQGYRANIPKEIRAYELGEKVWLNKSQSLLVSPYITRCLWWDLNQGHQNSRYWSHCFEDQLCFDFCG